MQSTPNPSPRVPPLVIALALGVLILGIAPMPYGYYTLLRLVAMAAFVWAAIVSNQRKHDALPWVFALAAILLNPIIKVHLDRSVWMWANIGAAVLLLGSARHIASRQ